jgi:predicted nucleic acid-binding protein
VISIDTSVWIEFFHGTNRTIANHVKELLDLDQVILTAPVKIEILSGSPKSMFARLRNMLSALPIYFPDSDTWNTIDHWLEESKETGQHFGFGDLLIGVLTVKQNAKLWSLDSDFERMQKLGWLDLYKPKLV